MVLRAVILGLLLKADGVRVGGLKITLRMETLRLYAISCYSGLFAKTRKDILRPKPYAHAKPWVIQRVTFLPLALGPKP